MPASLAELRMAGIFCAIVPLRMRSSRRWLADSSPHISRRRPALCAFSSSLLENPEGLA